MPKRQSKKQSREIGNIGYIRRRKTKQKQRASYKQLYAKTNQTSPPCGNHSRSPARKDTQQDNTKNLKR